MMPLTPQLNTQATDRENAYLTLGRSVQNSEKHANASFVM